MSFVVKFILISAFSIYLLCIEIAPITIFFFFTIQNHSHLFTYKIWGGGGGLNYLHVFSKVIVSFDGKSLIIQVLSINEKICSF